MEACKKKKKVKLKRLKIIQKFIYFKLSMLLDQII